MFLKIDLKAIFDRRFKIEIFDVKKFDKNVNVEINKAD